LTTKFSIPPGNHQRQNSILVATAGRRRRDFAGGGAGIGIEVRTAQNWAKIPLLIAADIEELVSAFRSYLVSATNGY